MRPRLTHAALLGAAVLVGSAGATGADAQGTVSEVSLPGGLQTALAAIGDRTPPDRAQFLAEFIRRTYDLPVDSNADARGAALRSLVAELKAAAAHSGPSDTLPLPLSDRIWIDAVFGGQATPQTVVSAILQSRNAALLYCGLLWLDDGTRRWLAGEPALIAELASGHAAAFLAAAPGLRVTAAGVQVPGGELAVPAWRALVGRGPEDPADFVRALVASGDGRLARFFGTIGQLTPPQVRVALNLALPDVPLESTPRGGCTRYSCASWTATHPSSTLSPAPRSTPRSWSSNSRRMAAAGRCCPGRAVSGRRSLPAATTARPDPRSTSPARHE